MKTGRRLSSLVAVVALLAACGGGAADDTTTTQPPATTTTPDTSTTEPDDDNGTGGLSGQCLEYSDAMTEAMEKYGEAFTGESTDFGVVADQLEALAQAAPEEIRDDFRIFAEELGAFYQAMSEFQFTPGATPTPEQMAAMQAALESVDEERLEAATTNIEAWVEENCS